MALIACGADLPLHGADCMSGKEGGVGSHVLVLPGRPGSHDLSSCRDGQDSQATHQRELTYLVSRGWIGYTCPCSKDGDLFSDDDLKRVVPSRPHGFKHNMQNT